MDASQNKVMWSLMLGLGGSDDLQPDVLKYHSADLRCRVQIDGSRLGFFEAGWLERRRVHRHLSHRARLASRPQRCGREHLLERLHGDRAHH